MAVLDVITNDSDVEGDAVDPCAVLAAGRRPRICRCGGHLVFDPGTDFNDLGEGRTATVSFTKQSEWDGSGAELRTPMQVRQAAYTEAPE